MHEKHNQKTTLKIDEVCFSARKVLFFSNRIAFQRPWQWLNQPLSSHSYAKQNHHPFGLKIRYWTAFVIAQTVIFNDLSHFHPGRRTHKHTRRQRFYWHINCNATARSLTGNKSQFALVDSSSRTHIELIAARAAHSNWSNWIRFSVATHNIPRQINQYY